MLEIWLPKSLLEEAMQKSKHRDAKLQPSKCKSKYFQFQPDMPSTYQPPHSLRKGSPP